MEGEVDFIAHYMYYPFYNLRKVLYSLNISDFLTF